MWQVLRNTGESLVQDKGTNALHGNSSGLNTSGHGSRGQDSQDGWQGLAGISHKEEQAGKPQACGLQITAVNREHTVHVLFRKHPNKWPEANHGQTVLSWAMQAAIAKYHRHVASIQQKFIAHSSGGWKSEVMVPGVGLFLVTDVFIV